MRCRSEEATLSRAAKSGPPPDHVPGPPSAWQSRWGWWLSLPALVALLVLLFSPSLWSRGVHTRSHTDFMSKVDADQVASVGIDDHGAVRGDLRDGYGFDQSSGIVVLAATNRPEALDPALLRPGRFDRQVMVPLPNQTERAAILAVHAEGKHLDSDVDLGRVSRATPGFSGADLANLINEAAIFAVRDDRTDITAADLVAARDRVLLGRRDSSNALLPDERWAGLLHH
ncbi:AAA family ATPase [Lentzea sp. HUAS12]|uniref:AAA family ATPase n=1 Tax=Lentzea sp. HUAS12 TaxID=2951806 RepID=UPI0020A21D8C|nr:AAA family ATPase [Lentzea sp. HUAS12]USX53972.1 AAA family ATPase [Lentzea sp. HUAS12]